MFQMDVRGFYQCQNCLKVTPKIRPGELCASCAETISKPSASRAPTHVPIDVSKNSTEVQTYPRFTVSEYKEEGSSDVHDIPNLTHVEIPNAALVKLLQAVGGSMTLTELDLTTDLNWNIQSNWIHSLHGLRYEIEISSIRDSD